MHGPSVPALQGDTGSGRVMHLRDGGRPVLPAPGPDAGPPPFPATPEPVRGHRAQDLPAGPG